MKPGESGPRRADWRAAPHPRRLHPSDPLRQRILDAHDRALAASMSTYRDPRTANSVFTADYLADRGYCCGQGCRHCPWEGGDENPDPDGE